MTWQSQRIALHLDHVVVGRRRRLAAGARLAWATAAPPAAGRFDPHTTLLRIGGGGSGIVLLTQKSETAKTLVKSIIHTFAFATPSIRRPAPPFFERSGTLSFCCPHFSA